MAVASEVDSSTSSSSYSCVDGMNALLGRGRCLPCNAKGCFSDFRGGPGSMIGVSGAGGGVGGGVGGESERRYCGAFNEPAIATQSQDQTWVWIPTVRRLSAMLRVLLSCSLHIRAFTAMLPLIFSSHGRNGQPADSATILLQRTTKAGTQIARVRAG